LSKRREKRGKLGVINAIYGQMKKWILGQLWYHGTWGIKKMIKENIEMANLIGALLVLKGTMLQCAILMDQFNKQHSEELRGAAEVTQTWIDGLDEDIWS
jgi:hypothetical protein